MTAANTIILEFDPQKEHSFFAPNSDEKNERHPLVEIYSSTPVAQIQSVPPQSIEVAIDGETYRRQRIIVSDHGGDIAYAEAAGPWVARSDQDRGPYHVRCGIFTADRAQPGEFQRILYDGRSATIERLKFSETGDEVTFTSEGDSPNPTREIVLRKIRSHECRS